MILHTYIYNYNLHKQASFKASCLNLPLPAGGQSTDFAPLVSLFKVSNEHKHDLTNQYVSMNTSTGKGSDETSSNCIAISEKST